MRGQPISTNAIQINSSGWEKGSLVFAFAIYIIWQTHAIFYHGSYGQDFGTHLAWVHLAVANPVAWLTTYDFSRTNPPMYHFLASLIFRIVRDDNSSLEIVALISMAINVIALYLIYRVIRQLVTVLTMRLACIIFLLFLPFAMIHAVVLASDGLATPCFLILLFFFTLLITPRSTKQFFMIAIAIAILLTLSLTVKFTFISLVPASILAYVVLYRVGCLSGKCAIAGILTILILPAIFGYFEFRHYHNQSHQQFGLDKNFQNPITSPYMNLRSLVLAKSVDKKLLLAPPYNYSEDEGKSFALLKPNYYSYPGLLHLAIFTDILNIYQFDLTDAYFGARTPVAQALMTASVRTGLLFSIPAAIAVPFMILFCFLRVWHSRDRFWILSTLVAIFSCAFFLNIVLFFPQIPDTYYYGYWLPRLIAPTILCFFILAFGLGDRIFVKRYRKFGWVCLVLVILQSLLHLSFLWPY